MIINNLKLIYWINISFSKAIKRNEFWKSFIKILTHSTHTHTHTPKMSESFCWRYMKAFEPKWVNSIWNIIGVNSLRIGGLHIYTNPEWLWFFLNWMMNLVSQNLWTFCCYCVIHQFGFIKLIHYGSRSPHQKKR